MKKRVLLILAICLGLLASCKGEEVIESKWDAAKWDSSIWK